MFIFIKISIIKFCSPQIEEEDVYSCLEATLVVMAAYMDQEKSIVTEKMVECANHLHGKFCWY